MENRLQQGSWEIPKALPSGFRWWQPGRGYICLCIPPLLTIQLQGDVGGIRYQVLVVGGVSVIVYLDTGH